jgi:hypothetical protein
MRLATSMVIPIGGFVTRTLGAAVGALIVILFMATVASRLTAPASAAPMPTTEAQR